MKSNDSVNVNATKSLDLSVHSIQSAERRKYRDQQFSVLTAEEPTVICENFLLPQVEEILQLCSCHLVYKPRVDSGAWKR